MTAPSDIGAAIKKSEHCAASFYEAVAKCPEASCGECSCFGAFVDWLEEHDYMAFLDFWCAGIQRGRNH